MKEHRILEDIASRREESVRLETDLRTIREAVVRLQENSGTDLAALQQLLGIFQENAMYYLMFKDWGPFEDFIGQLKTAPERDLLAVLHRFVIFLDTLTASVEKRAVLQALDSPDEHQFGSYGVAAG
jgi:hypothetical protein